MIHAIIEIGGSTLHVAYPIDTDTDTRFKASCLDTGDTLWIAGYNADSIDCINRA